MKYVISIHYQFKGKEERELCYTPLLQALEQYVPIHRNEDGSISPENQYLFDCRVFKIVVVF